MKRVNKNKHGFTLVELMTAIAIVCLIMGLFVSLIVAVKDSFYRTYTSNDAADYAYLYATALENYILKCAESDPGVEHKFTIDAGAKSGFFLDGEQPISLKQMTKDDGTVKWRVYVDGTDKGNGLIEYELYFVDNYINPGELVYTYTGTIWIPCHTGDGGNQPAATVKIENEGAAASWKGYKDEVKDGKSAVFYVTGANMNI